MADVIKKSWMRKRARGVNASIRSKNSNWKERWFELSAEEICYYDKCVTFPLFVPPFFWGEARLSSRPRCPPYMRTAHPDTVPEPPSPQAATSTTPRTGQPSLLASRRRHASLL